MPDKIRIMIVEDDFLMGMELSEFLSDDYEILSVEVTGEEAVQQAELLSPDLILMDIRLKGLIDGIEASSMIRLKSKVPIIFLTGYKDVGTSLRAGTISNSFLLTKPFNPDLLIKTIETVLG